MNEQRTVLEVIAPTVEEAIEKGLMELALPREAVEVEILDEGNRGLFGIGSRQARIRMMVKPVPAKPQPVEPVADAPSPIAAEGLSAPVPTAPAESSAPAQSKKALEDELLLHVARETVSELLEKMKVKAEIQVGFVENEDDPSRPLVLVDVTGDDLSILIGRQAETLNALQYIANLIVAKEMGRPVTLILDVEGYRKRREQQLRQLARRMADQAVATQRRQVLEPMPANERRIVHLELKENPLVTTESIGEEPHRKVTIIPK